MKNDKDMRSDFAGFVKDVLNGKTLQTALEFDHVCSADMAFHIPNDETLECIKKILITRKTFLDNS